MKFLKPLMSSPICVL